MIIADHKTIQEIQNEFNATFPNLKLEFYKQKHGVGEGSPIQTQLETDNKLRAIRNKHVDGDLIVRPELKVKELENAFEDQFGLHVQVFRKAGNLWMQTTATDDWSLLEQNNRGA